MPPSSRASLCLGLVVTSGGAALAQNHAPLVPTLKMPATDANLTRPASELTPQQIGSMQHALADWPQMNRYRADNAKLGDPAPGEDRVIFFGDSITDAWGRSHGRFFPGMPWVNRGISGQTTPQMLVRFDQDVLALHPRAVVILAGINDIAGNTGPETLPQIEDNFRSMVTLANAAHVHVVLSSILPASRIPWRFGADPTAEVVTLNAWLQSFAAGQGATYLDYYSALVAADGGMKPEDTLDGIHPSDAGYAVMEPLARATVIMALRPKRH